MLPSDPIRLFLETRERVQEREPWHAQACALATADETGRPAVRFVLVKEVDDEGFWFYSNEQSAKGHDLAVNPRAALCWHWASIDVQFRVEGTVVKAPAARSDAYFASRPRISQIGARASEQSRVIGSRQVLLDRVAEFEARFEGAPVPRPPHWGGYCLRPERIEHWIAGEYRLHDRHVYTRDGAGGWTIERLAP